MPLYRQLPAYLDEFDVIIAGGGTASCIVAGRLAAAHPNLSILVVESGPNNYNEPDIVNPALAIKNISPGSKTAIVYKGMKSKALAGRELTVLSGGTLGGGSSINLFMYTRAQRRDFDSWNMPGWSAEDLVPFMKKLETFHGDGDSETHGYDGPIQVSDGGSRGLSSQSDLLAAANKVGYPEIKDLQGLNSNNGFGPSWRTISKDGKRQDTAHAYLHPLLQDGTHPNLHVLVETKAVRVLFGEDKRASAVEFLPSPASERGRAAVSKLIIKARKLVVVSCGALGTPSVLERSGVGNADILKSASVPVVADVPGVGHNYQDHTLMSCSYKISPPDLGWATIDVGAKVRPTEDEVALLGEKFQVAWERDFKDQPNRPLMLMAMVPGYRGDPKIPQSQILSFGNYTPYPYSRGSIHITGPTIRDELDFETGFLSDDLDVAALVWAYKKHREVMRRTKMYRGELRIRHPTFPPGSKAACVDLSLADDNDNAPADNNNLTERDTAIIDDLPDLEYDAQDDKAIEQFIRENIQTTWHSLGTAKMAPRDDMGVVDKDLNVYGVNGLKVIDLSIVPQNIAANSCNTAMLIGEKGADIILRELERSI